jgi:prenyltransferase beta subunit
MKTELKNPQDMKSDVLNWVDMMIIKGAPYGTYKMSKSTEATLFSSCFAVFVRELYNDLERLTTKQREEWIELIQNCQDEESGFFIDPSLKMDGKFSETLGRDHDWGYVTWQSTTFCISALKALGGDIRYPFRFLEKWKNPEKIISWLENLDWRNKTWTNGNLAMFLGICLITDYELNIDQKTKETIDVLFAWHDDFQDQNTGFWGTNHGTPTNIGLFGAMHQFLLYYYMDYPLNFKKKIINHALLLQQPDGLFCPAGGGDGCEDLDVVDTLVNMYKRIEYRKDDVIKALQKAIAATINLQSVDGGFLWSKRYHFGIKNWGKLAVSISQHRDFRYWRNSCIEASIGQFITYNRPRFALGWTKTGRIPVNEADIFATWFRSLNLALISQVLQENPCAEIDWKFSESPGLGYFKKK